MADSDATTTKLLTLLNVSALKSSNRKDFYPPPSTSAKLNKRKSVRIQGQSGAESEGLTVTPKEVDALEDVEDVDEDEVEAEEETQGDESLDFYQAHFGPEPKIMSDATRTAAQDRRWKTTRHSTKGLGALVELVPDVPDVMHGEDVDSIRDKFVKQMSQRNKKSGKGHENLLSDVVGPLVSYQDLYLARASLESKAPLREAITMHVLNHVGRKRRKVLRNNERVSKATKDGSDPPTDVQDQGFTRASVLILLPFRSAAVRWMESLTSHTPSPEYQVFNHARFMKEYGLPSGVEDKLESAPPGTYPADHVEMFRGNVDDNFRIGVKVTRKAVRLFSDFYQCDIILASPLGLRMSIEKEKSADFLSSIEVLIADNLDALSMQNWEHFQYVFSNLNKIPKEMRDVDISRMKPWYLDGHAEYLRQSIILTAYETPEMRSIFNSTLKNVAGKRRTEPRYTPLQVPDGIEQTFNQFECNSFKDEPAKRFDHFVNKLLPEIMKSAVQSANTVVFVPSSFDFIRVQNHFRKQTEISYVCLSEYSTNQEISRARQAFFSGRKAFLIVSERFHFFRRYKLRGARNIIFYGLPDHPQFYSEFLLFPFLDDGVEPSDVKGRALFSKWDWLRLERIVGTEGAHELLKQPPV